LSQSTEKQLVDGCRKNNRKIQKQLYDRYCDAMFTIAFRIINNYDIANDALQEAFIQIFKDIKQFRGESTLGAWIKTILVRTAIKKLKKEDIFTQLEFLQNGEIISWQEEMKGEDLEKAILSLADGCRTIFLLIEVEGYKHKEVAEMLNISEGTSKSQLHYAKKQLQVLLKDYIDR
jgi:RNA polymerase sigma-70 factor (ECF subfamily)